MKLAGTYVFTLLVVVSCLCAYALGLQRGEWLTWQAKEAADAEFQRVRCLDVKKFGPRPPSAGLLAGG